MNSLDAGLRAALEQLDGWERVNADGVEAIVKTWAFKDFHHTMAFVNAVANVAHAMNHHPDLHVSYGQCVVRYTTHDTGGLTQRDVAAAMHIETLPEGRGLA